MNAIKDLLESEIAASEEFSKLNFGLKVGDGFPEMVREIAKSEKLSMQLIIGILMVGVGGGKGVADSMASIPDGQKPNFEETILRNLSTFEIPLSLFYWGIQVGQKMERESRIEGVSL